MIAPGDTTVTPLRFSSYPYSHSLLAVGLWAVALAVVDFKMRRRARGMIVLGALVLSHWVLDVVSHRPDMPLTPWSEMRVGLGLWESLPATLVVEGLVFVLGVSLYRQATRGRPRGGRFTALAVLLGVVYLASVFGPPPPSVAAIGIAGLLGALVILSGAAWVER